MNMKNHNGKKKGRKPNPLYVVTNRGRDVELVDSGWKTLLKKLGLFKLLETYQNLWKSLMEHFLGYLKVLAFKTILDQWVEDLKTLLTNVKMLMDIFLGARKQTSKAKA